MTEDRPGVDSATGTADDMAAMRARWAEAHGRSPDLPSDVAVLWAEVGRLRADLAKVREIAASRENDVMELLDERDKARADLAAARRERDGLAKMINERKHDYWQCEDCAANANIYGCCGCGGDRDAKQHQSAKAVLAALSAEDTDRTERDEQ